MKHERAWALAASAGLLSLENVGLLAALLFVRGAPPFVVAFLLLKFPLCLALVHRRHWAFLTLMLWESFTAVVALINPALTWWPRLGLLVSSSAGLTLLGLAIETFPTTELPRRTP